MSEDTSNIVDLNGWKVRRKEAFDAIKRFITDKNVKYNEFDNETLEKIFNGLNINKQQNILFEIKLKPKSDENTMYDVIIDPNFDENLKKTLWDIGTFVNQMKSHYENIKQMFHQIKAIEKKIEEVQSIIREKGKESEKARQAADAETQLLHKLEAERIILINALLAEREQLLQDYMQAKQRYEELKFAYNHMLDISAKEMAADLRNLNCFDYFNDEQLAAFSKRLLHSDISFCHDYKQNMQNLEQKIANYESTLGANGNGRALTTSFNQKAGDRKNIEHNGKMVSLNDIKAELSHKKRNYNKARKANIERICNAHGVKPSGEELGKIVKSVDDKKNKYKATEAHDVLIEGVNKLNATVDQLMQFDNNLHKTGINIHEGLATSINSVGVAEQNVFASDKDIFHVKQAEIVDDSFGNLDLDMTDVPDDDFGNLDIDMVDVSENDFGNLDADVADVPDDDFGSLDKDITDLANVGFINLSNDLLIESDRAKKILQIDSDHPESVNILSNESSKRGIKRRS